MVRRSFRIDWVLVDELAIGPAPSSEEHVDLLIQSGVGSVLSLCSEEEAALPARLIEVFPHRRVVLPDHQVGRPPTIEELTAAMVAMEALHDEHRSVFVHCVAAMERSPVVCLAWIMRTKRMSLQLALEYLMQMHPGTNPLPSQLSVLSQWYAAQKRPSRRAA